MTLPEFQAEFENARKFVRLHGWVVQSEEKLAPLRDALAEAAGNQDLYVETILGSFRAASTTPEKLFAICLLRDSKMTADAVAGLLLEHLQGALTSTDDQFFSRQFFRRGPPLPREVSAQITDRVYMTYQRAILQAMKIDKFESAYDANQIVLFMTQLLCRIDLNEQNRAILYLLLSRIDAPLPEALSLAVTQAMKNLEDVIRDVELRKERVLSESTPLVTAETHGNPWAPRSKPSAAAPVSPAPLAQGPKAAWLFELQPSVLERRSPAAVPHPKAAPPPPAPVRFPWGALALGSKKPAANRIPPASPQAWAGKEPEQTQTLSGQIRPTSSPAAGRSGPGDRSDLVEDPEGANWETLKRSAPSVADPVEGGRFLIRFDQERTGLTSLLDLVAHGSVKQPQEEAPPQDAAQRLPARSKSVSWWPFVGVVVLVLGVLGAWVVLSDRHAPRVPLPAASAVTAPKASEPAASGLDIRVEAGRRFWYPRAGESLWKLYSSLKGTESSPILSWTTFERTILSLNPSIAEADLIFPSIPLKIDH